MALLVLVFFVTAVCLGGFAAALVSIGIAAFFPVRIGLSSRDARCAEP
jgi:hypothetical protein